MYESAPLPPSIEPPQTPALPKHSVLGIISFVLSLVVLLGICATFGLATYVNSQNTYASDQPLIAVLGLLGICTIGLGLLGVILGIIALFQPAQSKVLAILGLALNALCALGLCGIIVLGLGMRTPF